MTRRGLLLAASTLLAGVAGWQTVALVATSEPLPVIETLGGDFTLDSTVGQATRLSDFQGEIVLLNFGYSHCPDVCPTTLARMRDVTESLAGSTVPVRSVFITLDPERDTLERIRPFVGHFGGSFVGMTGSDADIATAAAPFKVYVRREGMADSDAGYNISHSSHIYVLDTLGRVRTTFDQNVTVPDMIATIHRLQRESRWRPSAFLTQQRIEHAG